MPFPSSIRILSGSPMPGAAVDTARSLCRGFPGVPVCMGFPMPSPVTSRYVVAARYAMTVCDSVGLFPCGVPMPAHVPGCADLCEAGVVGAPDGWLVWDMASGRVGGGPEGGLWPMMDCRRLRATVGRLPSGRGPFVSVLWDAGREPPIQAFPVEGAVVLSTDPGADPDAGFARNPASVSAAAVCRAGPSFPYALATCMAMGRPCVALVDPGRPPCPASEALISGMGGGGCLRAESAGEAMEKASWLAAGGPGPERVALLGMQAACVFDLSRGLLAFRGLPW